MTRLPRIIAAALVVAAALPRPAGAQSAPLLLSAELEIHRVSGVGAAWQGVSLANAFASPVVACTYTLPSSASNSATVRLRNVGPGGFEVRVQQFETGNAVSTSDVYCLVAENGAHQLPDGRAFEAGTVLSDRVNGTSVGWTAANSERIDTLMSTSFADPVVFGSVMSFNDARASVFWTWNGANRAAGPTTNAIWVGKHIGQINGARATETLGYIVFEAGGGSVGGVDYEVRKGADAIAGVGNNPPYSYPVGADYDMAVAQQVAEDGSHGGWAVLYGADPLPAGAVRLAIEEETVAGDTTRTHTQEEVFWFGARAAAQAPDFALSKTVALHPDSTGAFMTPGSDVLYTLRLENVGTGTAAADSVFVFDTVPAELEFVNGDANGAAEPGTDPVVVSPGAGSGVTVGAIGYRNVPGAPASMADCPDGPGPAARHVCVALHGSPRPGSLYSDVGVDIAFRARIR